MSQFRQRNGKSSICPFHLCTILQTRLFYMENPICVPIATSQSAVEKWRKTDIPISSGSSSINPALCPKLFRGPFPSSIISRWKLYWKTLCAPETTKPLLPTKECSQEFASQSTNHHLILKKLQMGSLRTRASVWVSFGV